MAAVLPLDRATGKPVVIPDAAARFRNSSCLRPPTIKQLTQLAINIARKQAGLQANGVNRLAPMRPPMTLLPTVEEYAAMLRVIKRYDYTIEKNLRADTIKRYGRIAWARLTTISSKLNPTSTGINQYVNAMDQGPINYLVKPSVYFTELTTIARHFETYWNNETGCLEIWTDPISIVHPMVKSLRYNFGRMIIPVNTNHPKIIKPHTPRWARGEQEGHFHPHCQNDGLLCFGEGGTAATRAASQGRLYDVIDIIGSILRNYGHNPHRAIEDWNGICNEKFDPVTGRILGLDEDVPVPTVTETYCPNCGVTHTQPVSCYNDRCSLQNVCIGCVFRCRQCNNFTCINHSYCCEECGELLCTSHFTMDEDEVVCDRCYSEHDPEDR